VVGDTDSSLAFYRDALGLGVAGDGEITLKGGRVEQGNFDTYQLLRITEAPVIEVHIVQSPEPPGGMGEPGDFGHRTGGHECDLRCDWQTLA
jgi:catechol 2,3-dioxygenase-like lactoylglutathione lyase family enzyme